MANKIPAYKARTIDKRCGFVRKNKPNAKKWSTYIKNGSDAIPGPMHLKMVPQNEIFPVMLWHEDTNEDLAEIVYVALGK